MFDQAFTEELQRRYGSRPRSQHPELYIAATDRGREKQRAWMSTAVTLVPAPGRTKLITRLHAARGFLTAYHELAMAAILQDAGLVPEYETTVAEVTPDWFVPGRPPLLAEVWTRQLPDPIRVAADRWRPLRDRVHTIPVPVGLHIISPARDILSPPDAATGKRIVAQLQTWLLSAMAPPPIGARRVIEGYEFRVAQPVPGLRAILHTPTGGGWIDSSLLLEEVRRKVSRYARGARELGASLIVVIAAEAGSGMDANVLKAALAGMQSLSHSIDSLPVPGPAFQWKIKKWSTGVPETFDPALSAIGWLVAGIDSPGTLTLFPMANAEQAVPRLSSALVAWEEGS